MWKSSKFGFSGFGPGFNLFLAKLVQSSGFGGVERGEKGSKFSFSGQTGVRVSLTFIIFVFDPSLVCYKCTKCKLRDGNKL